MPNPFQVVRDFEAAIATYAGSPFAVSCTSCTTGLLMACAWFKSQGWEGPISMPKRSYVGVPASIKNAGYQVAFRDEDWSGEYQLTPLPLWDSARRTTSGMYRSGQMQVLSLHWSKILGLQQGGVILLDDLQAYEWLRRARFDGRSEGIDPKCDNIQYPSWHAYLSPEIAALGLIRLSLLPQHNADLPWSDYPDLGELEAFK